MPPSRRCRSINQPASRCALFRVLTRSARRFTVGRFTVYAIGHALFVDWSFQFQETRFSFVAWISARRTAGEGWMRRTASGARCLPGLRIGSMVAGLMEGASCADTSLLIRAVTPSRYRSAKKTAREDPGRSLASRRWGALSVFSRRWANNPSTAGAPASRASSLSFRRACRPSLPTSGRRALRPRLRAGRR